MREAGWGRGPHPGGLGRSPIVIRTFAVRTRMLGLAAASAAALLVASPSAAEVPLALAWRVPGGCPPREQVIAEVERLLASRAARSSRVTASATIAKSGGDYQLRMTIEGKRERVLTAPTCAEVADAAALILAIAINPSAAMEAPRKKGAPAAPPPQPPKRPPPRESAKRPPPPRPVRAAKVVAPRPAPPPPKRRFISGFATLGADEGTFVGATPQVRAGGAFFGRSLRLELGGHFTWGGRIASRSLTTVGAELWRAGGALSLCFDRALDAADPRAPRGALCGGFEAGVIHAQGYGVTDSVIAPWLAPTVGGVLRWPARSRVGLRVDLGVSVPIIEPVFRIVGVGTVHPVGAVSARGGVGVEVDIF
jgi:hypothetical protein